MRNASSQERSVPWRTLAVVAVLAAHAGLLAYSAARHSPTIHETAHLPSGICHWQFGMFELYRVNPPLPRMLAALPVLFCHPKTDWGNYQLDPLSRETIPMGIRFAKANGARTLFLFMVARWACIPFCLLGAWTCYRWASELWGKGAGLAALCLWCFDPMMLGHGAVVMPDVPGAAMGVFAAWRFWKWLHAPVQLPLRRGEGRGEEGVSRSSWADAAIAGFALGLAELCKTTLLIFFVLWPVAWLLFRLIHPARREGHRSHHAPRDGGITRSVMSTVAEALQLLVVLVLAIYVINLGYAFRGSCERLGDYHFQSRALSGEPRATPPKIGNRFRDTWLALLPVPLPRDYVQGIDRQRADFEEGGRSYLHGHWSPRGWWYYYLVGFGIKLPLGTLALLALAAGVSVRDALRRISVGNGLRAVPSSAPAARLPLPPGEGWGERPNARKTSQGDSRQAGKPDLRWRDELFLLSCGIAILALVSSQTGFSAHVRYAIPALPFFFIWCGKLFADGEVSHTNPKRQRGGLDARVPRWRFGLVWFCLLGTVIESLSVYPHSISFFNRLIGGPAHGHEWLLDSNGAWGQDLIYLKEWVERHPEARPLYLAAVGWLDPAVLGIDYTIPRVGPSSPVTAAQRAGRSSLSLRERAGGDGWRRYDRPPYSSRSA